MVFKFIGRAPPLDGGGRRFTPYPRPIPPRPPLNQESFGLFAAWQDSAEASKIRDPRRLDITQVG